MYSTWRGWFIAPTAASNFDLNFALEEEEAGTVHARIRVVLFQWMPYNFVPYISFYCRRVGEDADVYADDFHVIFPEEELQGSSDHVNQGTCSEWKNFRFNNFSIWAFTQMVYLWHSANETATFELNCDLEEDVLDGSSDEEHVEQG